MGLPRPLIRQVRRLDVHDLRRLQILVRGLLLHVDGEPTERLDPELPSVTYRQEWVRCGKQGCSGCPHGPYWYGYYRQDGRSRKQYVGRHLPGEPLEPVEPDLPS